MVFHGVGESREVWNWNNSLLLNFLKAWIIEFLNWFVESGTDIFQQRNFVGIIHWKSKYLECVVLECVLLEFNGFLGGREPSGRLITGGTRNIGIWRDLVTWTDSGKWNTNFLHGVWLVWSVYGRISEVSCLKSHRCAFHGDLWREISFGRGDVYFFLKTWLSFKNGECWWHVVSLIVRGESRSRINKQGVCLTKKKEGCWSYIIYFILWFVIFKIMSLTLFTNFNFSMNSINIYNFTWVIPSKLRFPLKTVDNFKLFLLNLRNCCECLF